MGALLGTLTLPSWPMADFFTVIPWICLLLVFGGMLALCWKLASGQHDLSTLLAQALAGFQPGAVPAPAKAAPSVAVRPAPLPVPATKPVAPTGPFSDYPAWFQWAVHEIGTHEVSPNSGPAVQRYISLAHAGSLGDPWCAIFANAALESCGITGTRSPSSQSFRSNPNFVSLSGPAKGAIVVYWRGSQVSGLGHVGFYRGEDATRVWTLGGNENDMVEIAALPKNSSSFGLIGYYWPASLPLPQIGAVEMPAGAAASVTSPPAGAAPATPAADGVQTNIIATYFGGQQSAYGPPINDNSPGVALPFRFTGTRPRVRVTGVKSGVSVDCDIVDIGPWNINDPYWQTGTRPQAESGMDLGQVSQGVPRRTNGAGIDLTLAAATAVGVDGKGFVSWQFIESAPAAPPATPNVA